MTETGGVRQVIESMNLVGAGVPFGGVKILSS